MTIRAWEKCLCNYHACIVMYETSCRAYFDCGSGFSRELCSCRFRIDNSLLKPLPQELEHFESYSTSEA